MTRRSIGHPVSFIDSFTETVRNTSGIPVLLALLTFCATPNPLLAEVQPEYLHKQNVIRHGRNKYCGAYVAWHAMQLSGKDVPIEALVERLGIEEYGYATLASVVKVLNEEGVHAEAVKLPFEELHTLDALYIPFLPPKDGQKAGHFILCRPLENAGLLVYDGLDCYIGDMTMLQHHEESRQGWDGTCILIDGTSSAFDVGRRKIAIALGAIGCIGLLFPYRKHMATGAKRTMLRTYSLVVKRKTSSR